MINKMQYKGFIIICTFLLYCFTAGAQGNNPDSIHALEKKLDHTNNAVAKLNILSHLSDYYQTADPKLAKKYEDLGLTLAKQIKRDSDVCIFYGYIGETYIYA